MCVRLVTSELRTMSASGAFSRRNLIGLANSEMSMSTHSTAAPSLTTSAAQATFCRAEQGGSGRK